MQCTIDWPLTLQGFKIGADLLIGAAWPVAAVWIASRFREPISRAIDRARKVSAMGLDAELLHAQAEITPDPVAGLLPAGGAAAGPMIAHEENLPDFDPVLSPIDDQVVTHLQQTFHSENARLRWLVRAASFNTQALKMERLFRLILHSQIEYLQNMKSRGPQVVTMPRTFSTSCR